MLSDEVKHNIATKYATTLPSNNTDIAAWYNQQGVDDYNIAMSTFNFNDPQHIISKVTSKKIHGGLEIPTDGEILDVGCGPGALGKELKPKGYSNMDGVDATDAFVTFAANGGNYRKLQVVWLGCNKMPAEYNAKYDVVLGSGVYMKGHFPAAAFDDIYTALKPGGFHVFGIREMYWTMGEEMGYRDKVQKMIDEGKWELVCTDAFWRGVDSTDDKLYAK
mmetsp:Transcript_97334/g.133919  ORF Transcript_97334/g.133919 Transcript_97334/m.133919 type:complete len:220 (+) Transcript_97334:121-780(+)